MAAKATRIAHVGQTVTLQCEMGIDLSTYGTKHIRYSPPTATNSVWSGTVDVDASAGIFSYTTTVNDLNQEGNWTMQGFASNTSSVAIGQKVIVQVEDTL